MNEVRLYSANIGGRRWTIVILTAVPPAAWVTGGSALLAQPSVRPAALEEGAVVVTARIFLLVTLTDVTAADVSLHPPVTHSQANRAAVCKNVHVWNDIIKRKIVLRDHLCTVARTDLNQNVLGMANDFC